MKNWAAAILFTLLAAGGTAAASQDRAVPPAGSSDTGAALAAALQARFDIVPLTNAVGLRPKKAAGDVRLIEVSDAGILVNGAPVTGRELRDRLGADADLVLRLSYLDAARRQALFGSAAPGGQPGAPVDVPVERPDAAGSGPTPDRAELPDPPDAPEAPESPQPPAGSQAPADPDEAQQRPARRHRTSGERVRVFGDVTVRDDESLSGQVVAVLGSARIDGEVGDQVVAVMGSVYLGPRAVVRGDVVSVGGRVRRAEGAQVRGNITEVSLADANAAFGSWNGPRWGGAPPFVGDFSGFPQLVGTSFRFLLLVLLASIALLVARRTVESSAQRVSDAPVQTTVIGVVAQLLLVPALILTVIVLAISIIGIPLLLLMPFALLLLVLMALAGFSGTVFAVGQGVRRRLGMTASPAFVDIFIGVLVVLLPLLLGRLLALGGWPGTPLAFVLLACGFAVEYLAWSSGFGAVLTNGYARWQARRAARTAV